jgi:hypothetical protein
MLESLNYSTVMGVLLIVGIAVIGWNEIQLARERKARANDPAKIFIDGFDAAIDDALRKQIDREDNPRG